MSQTPNRNGLGLTGGGRIPQAAAPDIRNRSYRITAHVEIPEGGAEGVLIAQGDWCGGYALYLKDGHLIHDYNFVNRHYVARSAQPVPAGRHTLSWVVRKTGEYTAEGELRIDDQPCGRPTGRRPPSSAWRSAGRPSRRSPPSRRPSPSPASCTGWRSNSGMTNRPIRRPALRRPCAGSRGLGKGLETCRVSALQ